MYKLNHVPYHLARARKETGTRANNFDCNVVSSQHACTEWTASAFRRAGGRVEESAIGRPCFQATRPVFIGSRRVYQLPGESFQKIHQLFFWLCFRWFCCFHVCHSFGQHLSQFCGELRRILLTESAIFHKMCN